MTVMDAVEFGDISAVAESARQRRKLPEDVTTGMVENLEFMPAPPTRQPNEAARRSSRWPGVLDVLKAHPGEWAKVGTFASATNRPKALKDAGVKFRVVSRTDFSPSTGTAVIVFDLWACYPAPF
jgi:hypothetical protein